VRAWLGGFHGIESDRLNPYLYAYAERDAIVHLLRVASGLDSMVLGEPQILGQVKNAFQTAADCTATGKLLCRLFQHAFSVAKTVRSDTAIGSSPVSVAFAAAILHLIQPEGGRRGLPKPELLDEIGYKAVVIGFPFLTLTIVLGAVWADVAWGSYWSWDPKETASLVTWLIYGAYLHARVVRGWRGNRAAWLLVLGFAATLFTYFGNLFFGGLHSYSGLG